MATLSTKFLHGIGIVVTDRCHVTEHEETCLLVMTCVCKIKPAAVHCSQIHTLGVQQQRCSVFCILIVLACVTVQVSGQGVG